jgi:hypothetical protein
MHKKAGRTDYIMLRRCWSDCIFLNIPDGFW